jgi:hypothetical protein
MLRRWHAVANRLGADIRRARGAAALCAVAAGLVVLAIGLRAIAPVSGDVPPIAELVRDAREVYGPAVADRTAAGAAWLHEHLPVATFVKLTWVRANGIIDARALTILSTLLHAAAVVGFLLLFVRRLGTREFAVLAIAAVAARLLHGTEGVSFAGDTAWAALILLLSLLHLHGLAERPAGSFRWWLGLIAGVLAVIAGSAGLASAAALLLWHAGVWLTQPARRRHLAPSFAANAALLGLGVSLAAVRAGHASVPAFSWRPVSENFAAIVVWLPALFCFFRWLGRHRDPRAELVALPALWVFVQGLLLRAFGGDGSAAELAVLANAACVALLPRGSLRARTGSVMAAGVWTVFVASGMAWSGNRPATPVAASADEVAALRSLLREGDAAVTEPSAIPLREAASLYAPPELRRLLPASLRSPLALVPESNSPPTGFVADGAPDLPARDALPCFGTWVQGGDAVTGEFVSAPLATTLPEIQIRVAGTLRPPETSLVLRTADGREIPPLTKNVIALERWTRVTFPAPRETFQIVARDDSRSAWLAFTAPLGITTGSRHFGKLPRLWPVMLAAGLLAFAGGLVLARRDAAATFAAGGEPLLNWRPLPWLAVFAYAMFISHHVDTTAGPNDSGGYLLSAKTLLDGQLTAIPRLLFPDETDITPYLPTTFHARADGRMSPEYPVGFPLEVWAVGQFLPLERAVSTLILLQLVLGVVFTLALARAMGLPDGWAWLAAAIVGLSPVYLFQGLQPQSDGPALVWVTAAVTWAWTSRQTPWHAVLAGLATALAVLIRPSNVLCLIPVVLCLAGSWRRLVTWALAGMPAAVWLMWYQHHVYGSWHQTGYGDVLSGFGGRFILPTLRAYAIWLPEMFTPVVLVALAAPFLQAIAGRVRLVLTAWCVVFGAFYAVYWCTWDNWYNMRFVLPAMPAAIVLGLLATRVALQRARARHPWSSRAYFALGAIAVVAILGWVSARTSARRVLYWVGVNREHAVGARWLRDHVPADAVVFAKPATNPLMYYTDFVFVRSDHPAVRDSPAWFERLAQAGRPIYALTYHWEARGLDRVHDAHGDGHPDLPGDWERVAAVWEDDLFVWRQRPMLPRPDGR